MNSASPQLSWRIGTPGVFAGVAPFLGAAVRVLTGSSVRLIAPGIAIWLFGAVSLAYVVRQIPSARPKLMGRVLLWTMVTFLPGYVASVLIAGALRSR